MLFVFGTRPEAIKLAPLILALGETSDLVPIVVVTAQHRQMLDQVLEFFRIDPDHDLDVHRPGRSLSAIAASTLDRLDPVIEQLVPDMLVVQGDTTSTLAGALAGFHRGVPVTHVEAGLRSFDRAAPFPEEVNRRAVSQLADLHLAPTPTSAANLAAEGICGEDVVCTGNLVIDALDRAIATAQPPEDHRLADLAADPRRLLLVTVHRRESWGAPLRSVGRALGRLARERSDLVVVLPLHLNPLVREAIAPEVAGLANVLVVPPLAYGSFAWLIDRADLVLTDSGGIQEEAPSRGTPVLVLRETTERPEAVTAGTARLVGTDEDRIVDAVTGLLDHEDQYLAMARAVNPFGDGNAAARSVAAIRWRFGTGSRPEEFAPSR